MPETFNIDVGRHQVVITQNVGKVLTDFLTDINHRDKDIFVLMDENTHKHCFSVVSATFPAKVHKLIVGSGEQNKNLHTCEIVWKNLLNANADRASMLINLGGGMITDLGGFIASCYKRGISFINIPTSLLGMVDASCGGKTGVDLDGYKNMIGVFAFPQTVIVDPVFLQTLPEHEWRSGMSEVIKHAIIDDVDLFSQLEHLGLNSNLKNKFEVHALEILKSAISIKSKIVKSDPYEKAERKFLNFGHTIGHAFETHSLKNSGHPISHGEAVAAGMICELFLSAKYCGLKNNELERAVALIKSIFDITQIPKQNFSELNHLMRADKKSVAGNINYALINEIGKPVLFNGVSDESLYESFHFYNSNS